MINNMNLDSIPTPCFIIDQDALERNLRILARIKKQTNAKILLALKAFAMTETFELLRTVLDGTCASGPDEARLGREEFGREVHTFSPAYTKESLADVLAVSDHVVFNSRHQWDQFRKLCRQHPNVCCGLRINPEHSETETRIYDPCAPCSRLGMTRTEFEKADLDNISGIHFHTLCEQDSFALERTLDAVEENFGAYLQGMDWINMGGGHHMTRPDYDVDHLCRLIDRVQDRYSAQVYLEPGEAVVLNAGIYVTSVLDVVHNAMDIAIIDGSVAAHLPDVLEMPYRPHIKESTGADEKPYTYRICGNSCLAGDIMGDYSFDAPLAMGDKLVCTDMAHYTMVKTNTFNGIRLPSIGLLRQGTVDIVRTFGYNDFRSRLA